MTTVHVRLMGEFEVTTGGGPVPPDAWSRRHAASLVKLLALAPEHRMHREQVVDALWPDLTVESAGPRLHKAAHYARRALGAQPGVLVLRQELVHLVVGGELIVDLDLFRRAAEHALGVKDPDAGATALDLYGGPLLPDDVYEPWTVEDREVVRNVHVELLRLAARWPELLREDPTDEEAHLALVRGHVERGDLRSALRQFEQLDQALQRELGTRPSAAAQRLRRELRAQAAGLDAPQSRRDGEVSRRLGRTRLYGRRHEGDLLRRSLEHAGTGHGSTVVFSGPAGVGKTAVLDLAEALARREGWRCGRGTAAAAEGSWPYAPVLEALRDLCRQHPALLDGLDDAYRVEIDRALSGADVAWTGESGHQRLFVAVAELVRLAAAGEGLLLAVDDLHEADAASIRLLHYVSRVAATERVLLVLAHRQAGDPSAEQVTDGLLARGHGTRVELTALSESTTRRFVAERFPELTAEDAEHVWTVTGGLPFLVLELARRPDAGRGTVLPPLPQQVLRTFQRAALLGSTFTTDELLAVSGVPEDETYQHLASALESLLVEPTEPGYRFRHALVREALLDQLTPGARTVAIRDVALALTELPEPPGRVAHQLLAAGLHARAVPFAVRAVETAAALGAYRDALDLVDAIREHAPAAMVPGLLARRGDLLLALGDPAAVSAYLEAVAVTTGTQNRLVRARLARAAAFTGDLDLAGAALAGLDLEGDEADGPILLATGNVAYFRGDIDTAWDSVRRARDLLRAPDDRWQLVDVVALQGLIAHQRGEWFERFRMELRRTEGRQRLVTALFDAHLCVAEFVLYGLVPYQEVIAESEELRRRAQQAGALRGVAFATAVIGEAALLSGDLVRAERELVEAVELHRDIEAAAGEAHSLERLAELRLVQGRPDEARALLQRALPLARWSVIAPHLMQRVLGTMILAAPDPPSARDAVDVAEATMGLSDRCSLCVVMLAVPAAIACADVGDVDAARAHLTIAETSATRWEGTAWQASVREARAHLARAEGLHDEAEALMQQAAMMFRAAGHVLDADRCAAGLPSPAQAGQPLTPGRTSPLRPSAETRH